ASSSAPTSNARAPATVRSRRGSRSAESFASAVKAPERFFDEMLAGVGARFLQPRISARFFGVELLDKSAGADFREDFVHFPPHASVDQPRAAEQRAELGRVGDRLAHCSEPALF